MKMKNDYRPYKMVQIANWLCPFRFFFFNHAEDQLITGIMSNDKKSPHKLIRYYKILHNSSFIFTYDVMY